MRMLGLNLAVLCIGVAGLLIAVALSGRGRKAERRRLERFLAAGMLPSRAQVQSASDTFVQALPEPICRKLYRAGFEPRPRSLAHIGLLMLTIVLLAGLAGGALAAFAAGIAALALGAAAVEYTARHRMQLLSGCMIGFLERIRQLLAVGNSLATALTRATANSPPIVVAYMNSTVRRIANGKSVAESIERCAAELDLYEMHLLATATRTHMRFGGSMTTILSNMVENIRRRTTVERELRANTAQTRFSALVLAGLPVLVGVLVMLSNRSYSQWFVATTAGHHMLAYASASQLAGLWLMRLITRTRY
jgi:tight adherence protein B